MILGYSELVKRIAGVTPETLRDEYATFLKAKPTPERIEQVRILARIRRGTISEILRAHGSANTGGSFVAAKQFFDRLAALGIVRAERVGRRTYYVFVQETDLARWLRGY